MVVEILDAISFGSNNVVDSIDELNAELRFSGFVVYSDDWLVILEDCIISVVSVLIDSLSALSISSEIALLVLVSLIFADSDVLSLLYVVSSILSAILLMMLVWVAVMFPIDSIDVAVTGTDENVDWGLDDVSWLVFDVTATITVLHSHTVSIAVTSDASEIQNQLYSN